MFFNKNPTNWDRQFNTHLSKTSSKLYILGVCKFYGYSLNELTTLHNSLNMCLFNFGIKCGVCILSRIDKFNKRAFWGARESKILDCAPN